MQRPELEPRPGILVTPLPPRDPPTGGCCHPLASGSAQNPLWEVPDGHSEEMGDLGGLLQEEARTQAGVRGRECGWSVHTGLQKAGPTETPRELQKLDCLWGQPRA